MRRIENAIRGASEGDYQVHLLSGHSGSGKSTEMRWLARCLQRERVGDERVLYPVFIQIDNYLNELDIQIPEFLTAIITALLEDVRVGQYLLTLDMVQRFWKDLQQWVKGLGVTLESEIPLGIVKLKGTFRMWPGFQKSYREENDKYVKRLLETLSDLIIRAREILTEQGTHDLLIMIDKLDRIERLPLGDNTGRTRHDLFYLEQLPSIQGIPVHFVLTVPVTPHFAQNRLRQVFHSLDNVILPMVAVRERKTMEQPFPRGIEALTRLLGRRVSLSETFADTEALHFAIYESGGCLRDLFHLVSEAAINKQALKLTTADIEVIVKENTNNMERLLQGRGFLRDLHHIVKTGSFPEGFNDETKQWLLYNLVVIEYNGETWYDVHPFARRTRAFREAAP
ncbi:MAG TPA: AAA family ATPase [Polyangium sp.]|nr:AAA family ATPase [Polyangium sp.]